MVLKKAYVQQAVCSPYRTSVLTGQRPDTTRVYDLDTYWRNAGGNFTNILQYFKDNGYTSIGIEKIFHPGAALGYDDPLSWSTEYFRPRRTAIEASGPSCIAVPDEDLAGATLLDEQVADNAVETLRNLQPMSSRVNRRTNGSWRSDSTSHIFHLYFRPQYCTITLKTQYSFLTIHTHQ